MVFFHLYLLLLQGMAGFIAGGIRKDHWVTEAKEVFSENNFTQAKYPPSFNTAFKELTRLYKEHTTAWWEVQSLQSYITNNIVPRGLRSTLTPSNRCRNPTFMVKWEKEATASSIRFMHLLVEEEKTNLTQAEIKLKEQIEITKKFEHEAEYTIKEKKLQGTIERFEYHLKDRKHKQYQRDCLDFKEHRAYSFVPRQGLRETEVDISSTDTDYSDTDRDQSGRGGNYQQQTRGGKGSGKGRGKQSRNRGQGQGPFSQQRQPYHLRERNFQPPKP